jgi:hypothetical protein
MNNLPLNPTVMVTFKMTGKRGNYYPIFLSNTEEQMSVTLKFEGGRKLTFQTLRECVKKSNIPGTFTQAYVRQEIFNEKSLTQPQLECVIALSSKEEIEQIKNMPEQFSYTCNDFNIHFYSGNLKNNNTLVLGDSASFPEKVMNYVTSGKASDLASTFSSIGQTITGALTPKRKRNRKR